MSSTPSLLICQALILLPDSEMRQGDLRIQQGQIAQIAPEITPTDSDIVIDATGLTLLPGVIDPQVHFRELGLEHQEDLFTATRACARRGVTSFLEMPNTRPLTTTQATLDDKLRRAAQKSLVNYGFFIGATAENLPDLLTALFAALKFLWVRLTELCWSVKLALKLSKKYQRRLHILHLSTGIEAELLREDKPSWMKAEVTPQHLLLNTEAYAKIGTLAQMNPLCDRPKIMRFSGELY